MPPINKSNSDNHGIPTSCGFSTSSRNKQQMDNKITIIKIIFLRSVKSLKF